MGRDHSCREHRGRPGLLRVCRRPAPTRLLRVPPPGSSKVSTAPPPQPVSSKCVDLPRPHQAAPPAPPPDSSECVDPTPPPPPTVTVHPNKYPHSECYWSRPGRARLVAGVLRGTRTGGVAAVVGPGWGPARLLTPRVRLVQTTLRQGAREKTIILFNHSTLRNLRPLADPTNPRHPSHWTHRDTTRRRNRRPGTVSISASTHEATNGPPLPVTGRGSGPDTLPVTRGPDRDGLPKERESGLGVTRPDREGMRNGYTGEVTTPRETTRGPGDMTSCTGDGPGPETGTRISEDRVVVGRDESVGGVVSSEGDTGLDEKGSRRPWEYTVPNLGF